MRGKKKEKERERKKKKKQSSTAGLEPATFHSAANRLEGRFPHMYIINIFAENYIIASIIPRLLLAGYDPER